MGKRIWSKERVIRELRELSSKLGYSPKQIDTRPALRRAAVRYYGSWNTAKQEAGLRCYDPSENLPWVGRKTRADAIRSFLYQHSPSLVGEIRLGLNLTPIQANEIYKTKSVLRATQEERNGVTMFYLKGQEYLLPPGYEPLN